MKINKTVIIVFAISGLILTIMSSFAWLYSDDFFHAWIFNNGRSLGKIAFDSFAGNAYAGLGDNHYRPITNIVVSFLFQLKSMVLLRVLRIIPHLICGFLFYFLLKIFFRQWQLALIGSVLFLFSPVIHSNSYYVASLCDPLPTLFALLASILFLKLPNGH
jgi:hypothetical protein